MVTFEVFVRPALRFMSVHMPIWRNSVEVTMAEPVTTSGGLTHFLRVMVDDERVARLTGPQGSGLLTSMVNSNALLIVPHDVSYLDVGATARALLLAPGYYPHQVLPWTF
jgi:molybdopterin molybdotransferase